MADRSSYTVKYPSQGSQFKTGFAQSFAEQLPKEIERYRLAQGLKNFEQEAPNLNPLQAMSRLLPYSGMAGFGPQAIATMGELARQQQKIGAAGQRESALQQQQQLQNQQLADQQAKHNQQVLSQTDRAISDIKKMNENVPAGKQPTITEAGPYIAAQRGYVPPSQAEINLEGLENYRKNPLYYDNNPNKAIEEVEKRVDREIQQQSALEKIQDKQKVLQEKAVQDLREHSNKLQVKIPENLYDRFEDKFLDLITPDESNPKKTVMTPEQAKKVITKEMDMASRDYDDARSYGKWGSLTRPSPETRSSLESLQKRFKERDDTRNFADELGANLDISPELQYAIAEPVKDFKQLNSVMKSIPSAWEATGKKGQFEDTKIAGRSAFPRIFESLKKGGGSPLSVAHELRKKGYNANEWLDYATKRQEELSGLQINQLGKKRDTFGTLSDYWLGTFSGIGE